jgi:uncharacterized protein (DUF305 family)
MHCPHCGKTVEMKITDLIKEHTNLIKVLKEGKPVAVRREIKSQTAELKKYEKHVDSTSEEEESTSEEEESSSDDEPPKQKKSNPYLEFVAKHRKTKSPSESQTAFIKRVAALWRNRK